MVKRRETTSQKRNPESRILAQAKWVSLLFPARQLEYLPDQAVVVVLIPIGKTLTKSNGRLVAEDIIVDYHVQR